MTRDELIKAIEAARGPSRKLDAEIAIAIFKTICTDDDLIYAYPVRKYDECAPGTYWRKSRSGASLQTAPRYTESLDAALSLVPPILGIMWDVAKYPGESAAAYVGPHDTPLRAFVIAATPALALCAAALRAMKP